MAVLQDLAGAEAAGGLQKRFQLLQSFLRGRLVHAEAIGIQTHQHCAFAFCFKCFFHSTSGTDRTGSVLSFLL